MKHYFISVIITRNGNTIKENKAVELKYRDETIESFVTQLIAQVCKTSAWKIVSKREAYTQQDGAKTWICHEFLIDDDIEIKTMACEIPGLHYFILKEYIR